jgi:hypothetical protein
MPVKVDPLADLQAMYENIRLDPKPRMRKQLTHTHFSLPFRARQTGTQRLVRNHKLGDSYPEPE